MDAPAIPKDSHVRLSDLQGLGRLTVDGITGLTRLVEALHRNVAPRLLGAPESGVTTGITGLVYRSIRNVTGRVGDGLDAALGTLERASVRRRTQ